MNRVKSSFGRGQPSKLAAPTSALRPIVEQSEASDEEAVYYNDDAISLDPHSDDEETAVRDDEYVKRMAAETESLYRALDEAESAANFEVVSFGDRPSRHQIDR